MLWLALLGCPSDPPTESPDPVELVADAGPARTVPVGVSVKLDGSASEGAVSYLWDAGDGTTYTDPAPTHIYRDPGNHTAILQVTGVDGSTRTASTRVTVHPRPAEVLPASSSTLTVGEDGRVWGLVRDANALFVADPSGVSVIDGCLGGDAEMLFKVGAGLQDFPCRRQRQQEAMGLDAAGSADRFAGTAGQIKRCGWGWSHGGAGTGTAGLQKRYSSAKDKGWQRAFSRAQPMAKPARMVMFLRRSALDWHVER